MDIYIYIYVYLIVHTYGLFLVILSFFFFLLGSKVSYFTWAHQFMIGFSVSPRLFVFSDPMFIAFLFFFLSLKRRSFLVFSSS